MAAAAHLSDVPLREAALAVLRTTTLGGEESGMDLLGMDAVAGGAGGGGGGEGDAQLAAALSAAMAGPGALPHSASQPRR